MRRKRLDFGFKSSLPSSDRVSKTRDQERYIEGRVTKRVSEVRRDVCEMTRSGWMVAMRMVLYRNEGEDWEMCEQSRLKL